MDGEKPHYAHSMEGVRPEQGWQTLQDHLDGVANRAARFAEGFGSAEWARVAAHLHDYGKADPVFQAYLLRANGLDDKDYDGEGTGRVNHSSAGAALAMERFRHPAGKLLAYLVAGHHAGLPDWHSSVTGGAALSVRMEEGKGNLERIREGARFYDPGWDAPQRPPAGITPPGFHLWIRMLFSCLVDADFLDTEAFLNPTCHTARSKFPPVTALKALFDGYMEEKTARAPKTPVNTLRGEILSACREAATGAPGMYTLTVPTGGGKTLSGLAFALDHAARHGKRRIIYVIPYTSIIEQTAGELRRILGDANVIEHHSSLDPENETQRSRLAAENWDAPVIVTTNVQFFESLYAAKPSRCRKLHNISDSVVILDEAQMLPPGLLEPCVGVMNLLVRNFGVTLLLSTATQPAPPGLDSPTEIIPDPAALYKRLRRVEFHFPADLNTPAGWGDVARRLMEHHQVLCVVNTRRHCADLFALMPPGTVHLSALMCGRHRSEVIADVKQRLQNGTPARVVSTQLVEAGVDMDFPVVYRALAGLDSIAQAAGRCNREGRMDGPGKVHVFVSEERHLPDMVRKGAGVARSLLAGGGMSLDTPETFSQYFAQFYGSVNDLGGREFHDLLVKDVNPDLHIQFRTAAEKFKLIDDGGRRPVFVLYGESPELLERLRRWGPNRDLMRGLQRYTVNINARLALQLLGDGLLEEVWPGYLAQSLPSSYDPVMGFVTSNAPPTQRI